MMEPTTPPSPSNATRMIDSLGTVLVSVLLLAGSGVAWMGSRFLMNMSGLTAEMGENDLPMGYSFLTGAQGFHALDALIMVLFTAGVLALILIRERLQANFYGGLVAVLLVATGGVFYFTGMTPLVQIITTMDQ